MITIYPIEAVTFCEKNPKTNVKWGKEGEVINVFIQIHSNPSVIVKTVSKRIGCQTKKHFPIQITQQALLKIPQAYIDLTFVKVEMERFKDLVYIKKTKSTLYVSWQWFKNIEYSIHRVENIMTRLGVLAYNVPSNLFCHGNSRVPTITS